MSPYRMHGNLCNFFCKVSNLQLGNMKWDLTFFGIKFFPGFGAPREGKGPQKENLMKILHYPNTEMKGPTNVA